jgi:hypothetical protein
MNGRNGKVLSMTKTAHQTEIIQKGGVMFETKDSGERVDFPSGMRRDIDTGKPRYDLVDDAMLERWAALMKRGADKYTANNWRLANSTEELERFKASAIRHMYQWKRGLDTTEDHAAAVMFNISAAEYLRDKLGCDINGETWAFVPSLKGIQASDCGNVRRADGFQYKKWRNCWGYELVSLSGQEKRHYQVHRLVMEAFIGSADGLIVNHIDGTKHNNNVFNLEYVTYSENARHAYATGLSRPPQKGKISFEDAETIRFRVDNGEKQKDLSKEYGITAQTVNDIVKFRTWVEDRKLDK